MRVTRVLLSCMLFVTHMYLMSAYAYVDAESVNFICIGAYNIVIVRYAYAFIY